MSCESRSLRDTVVMCRERERERGGGGGGGGGGSGQKFLLQILEFIMLNNTLGQLLGSPVTENSLQECT